MFLMPFRENTYQRNFYQRSYEFLDIGLEDHLKHLKLIEKVWKTGMDNHTLIQLAKTLEE